MEIQLNLLAYKDRLDFRKNKKVFDPIRRKEIVVTPEELVRQLLLIYLMEERDFPKNRISVEKQLTINGRPKRFDILVYCNDAHPLLLVECKAPNVPIDEKTFDQIVRYNMALKVNYLLMTNGLKTYCCYIDYKNDTFELLEAIPKFEELKTTIT